MFALIITSATHAVAAIPQSERAVLLNLYNQTNGPQTWVNKTEWNGNPGTECTWYGITCDSTGSTVTQINLSGNALQGTLSSLLPLTNLQYFNVSGGGDPAHGVIGNTIVGAIPSLAGMAKLQQFLVNNNQLSGPIPPLTGLAQLTTFDATYNLLTSLPDLTGATNLVYFKVANNVLAGSIPSLSGLINLNYFNVSNNDLVGSVPALNGLTNLSTFNVESNQLTGALPDFSDLRNLTYFEVSQNLLNGQIPDLVGAPNLQYFDVSLNQLTGSLPALSSLMNLQQFGTTGNHLTGKVPPIANLQNLALFDIDYNQQSGPLPSPPSQFASGSPIVRLCPNLLTPASTPASAADAIWSLASGTTPWSLDCSPSPTWMTLTSLTSNLNPSVVGQPVTLTAAVYGMNPTGTVTFTATQALTPGVNTICANVPLVNSLATCTSTTLPTGSTNAIKAQYSGDQNNASSNNISVGLNVYQNVYDSPFSSALSSTLNPAQVGQAVLLKVDLTGAPYNVATVSFLDGTTPLCTDTNAGSDSAGRLTLYCVATFVTPGLHALTVSASNGAAVTTSNSVSENVVAAVPFDANQFALTGSWYNPSTSGQGMLLEVYPDLNGSGNGLLFGGWFTYDAAGDEDWVSLQGNITSSHGSSYDLTIGYGSGGNFNAGPVTHPIANGSATLTFNDCTHATFVYNFTQGPGSGVIPYTRVTSPTGCSDSVPASFGAATPANYNDVLHSGAWYNPATSGQGILVDIVPSQSTFAAAWFTYAPQPLGLTGDSTERWFTLQTNSYTPGNLALKGVPIYASRGGNFNQSAPPVVSSQVGTANVTFLSCTAMTIDYVFNAGEFKGLSGSINEQNLGPVAGCQ